MVLDSTAVTIRSFANGGPVREITPGASERLKAPYLRSGVCAVAVGQLRISPVFHMSRRLPSSYQERSIAMRVLLAAVTGLLVLVSTSSPRADSPAAAYKIVKKIPLGGEGGWDYLTMDSENHRLYITRGTHVTVLDVETGTEVGDITNLKGIHGVALCPKLNRGFITNGGDGM